MKRFFTLVLEALALVAVALISAFIAMRLAIHGREAVVPNLSGVTVAEANSLANRSGLNLTLENRFYASTFPWGAFWRRTRLPVHGCAASGRCASPSR